MADIFTRRLAAANVSVSGLTKLYTAQTGQTTIIRDLVVTPLGGTAGQLGIYIQVPGGQFFWLALNSAASGGTSLHFDVRQELRPLEELWVQAPNPVTVIVTGYVFNS